MDIMSVIFQLDPISFACGAASTGALTGGVAWIHTIRKNRSSKGVDAAREKYLESMKPQYSSAESLFASLEELADEVEHEFVFAYPQVTFSAVTQNKTRVAGIRTNLNKGLAFINTVENTHLDKKTLDTTVDNFRKLFQFLPDDIQSVRYAFEDLRRKLDTDQSSLVKFQNAKKDIEDRMTVLNGAYADAEGRFARVYLEKIPPAIFQAEKQYAALVTMLDEYSYAPHLQSERNALSERALTAIKKAENHMNTALNFSDVARRKTAKMRVDLRNSLAPRDAEEEVLRDAAVLSLMDAESFSYVDGNPPETFDAMIMPYYTYVRTRRTMKRRR